MKTGIVCSGEQGKSRNKSGKQNPALLSGSVRKARESSLKDGGLASANMELSSSGMGGPDFGVGEERH